MLRRVAVGLSFQAICTEVIIRAHGASITHSSDDVGLAVVTESLVCESWRRSEGDCRLKIPIPTR